MRSVQLNTVITSCLCPHRSGNEIVSELLNLFCGETTSPGFWVVGGAYRSHVVKRFRYPITTMVELHDCKAPGRPNLVCHGCKRRDVIIPANPQLSRKRSTNLLHVCSCGHRHSESTVCSHRQPLVFVRAQRAVIVALLIRQRGEHEAIWHRWAAQKRHCVKRRVHEKSLTDRTSIALILATGRARFAPVTAGSGHRSTSSCRLGSSHARR